MLKYDDKERLEMGPSLLNKPFQEENPYKDELIGWQRSFAETQSKMSIDQRKLLIAILTQIRWSETDNNNVVELDKKKLAEALELKIEYKDRSRYLRSSFQKLIKASWIEWEDPEDKEIWNDGFILTNMKSTRNKIYITISQEYMPLFENLMANPNFLLMYSDDIYKFSSLHAFYLYQELSKRYDKRYWKNERIYTTKQLKDIFRLSKEDYMRPKEKGGFDRYNFEIRCIKKAVDEINSGEMIQIWKWEKIKENGYITGYRFIYSAKTRKDNENVED